MAAACAQCAGPIEDGATVCARCGAGVAPSTPAPFVPTFSMESDPEGIGGWLLLVAIGLAIAPLRSVHGIFVDLRVMYVGQYQEYLSTRPGMAGLILYEAATNTIFLFTLILLNYLFYSKKKSFPWVMIGYLAAQAVLILVDEAVALQYFPTHSAIAAVQGVLIAVIWIPYYPRSRRVKATFVR